MKIRTFLYSTSLANKSVAVATNNFYGPQIVRMWRNVEWNQNLTTQIDNAPIYIKLYDIFLAK